jgi:hypothetical protein
MSDFSINWKNEAEIKRAVRRWLEIFAEEIVGTLEYVAEILVGKTADLTPVGTGGAGNLASSIGADRPTATSEGWIVAYGTTADHAEPIEYGRTPGSTMPPVEEITRWLWLKGPSLGFVFETEEEAEQIAFNIARKIAARGFTSGPVTGKSGGTAWAMFQRGQVQARSEVDEAFRACRERIARRCSEAA